jgi:hypothetical protein
MEKVDDWTWPYRRRVGLQWVAAAVALWAVGFSLNVPALILLAAVAVAPLYWLGRPVHVRISCIHCERHGELKSDAEALDSLVVPAGWTRFGEGAQERWCCGWCRSLRWRGPRG